MCFAMKQPKPPIHPAPYSLEDSYTAVEQEITDEKTGKVLYSNKGTGNKTA